MLCQTLKMAPGTVAIAIVWKCCCANEQARPEFCMPTSTLMAVHFGRDRRSMMAVNHPKR